MEFSESALQQVRERRLLVNQLDAWLFEEMGPFLGQRILEVGCGLGNFARYFTDRQLYVGSDIDTECVTHLAQIYRPYSNMTALVADICAPDFADLARYHFDTVFSVNALEHVEDDVTALSHAAEVLRPGGNLVLIVPAHGWLYGTMDRSIGHYRRYNKRGMTLKLNRVGLQCVTLRYFNVLGALGWFVNGRILRQSVPPSAQLQLINVLMPAIRALERTSEPPFGISLLAVARKDATLGAPDHV